MVVSPGGGPLRTAKETGVVFEKQTNVSDPVTKHGNALHPHPKGKSRIFLRVVSYEPVHGRIDHPATEDFEPPGVLAYAAAGTAANDARISTSADGSVNGKSSAGNGAASPPNIIRQNSFSKPFRSPS